MWDVSVVTASWPCYCRGLGAQANTDEAFRQRGPQAQKPAARPGPPGAGAADKGPSDVGSWPGLLQLPPPSRCGGAGAPRRPRPAPGPPLHGLLYAHPLSPPLFGWILLNCWMQLRGRKKVWKNRGLGLGAGRRGSCRARESPRESRVLGCLTWSVTLPILSDAPPWRSSHRPRVSPPNTATRPGGRPVTAALQLRPQLFSRLLQPPTLKKAGVPPTHLKAPESPPPGSLPGSLLPPTRLHVLCSCAPRAPWLPLSRPPDWV